MKPRRETLALARMRIFRQALELGWRVTTHKKGGRWGAPIPRPYLELPLGEDNDEVRVYITRTQVRFSHAGFTESVDSGLDMRGLTVIDLKEAIQGWS